ncbi:hypothetical protein V6N11_068855 [Hibiscus sabdariffa]|uniref:Uncharacterized protein n=1 Tax=Hibiscus sabdariffa TaxID=183260 RepID=A0ABR2PBB9_9ROSI
MSCSPESLESLDGAIKQLNIIISIRLQHHSASRTSLEDFVQLHATEGTYRLLDSTLGKMNTMLGSFPVLTAARSNNLKDETAHRLVV